MQYISRLMQSLFHFPQKWLHFVALIIHFLKSVMRFLVEMSGGDGWMFWIHFGVYSFRTPFPPSFALS